ncbi:unnamed protein product, partial [marine sediment metagenome]
LITHIETDISGPEPDKACKIIKPESIPFISYPYEWCFSQLKDAALTTFKIQKIALVLLSYMLYQVLDLRCRSLYE